MSPVTFEFETKQQTPTNTFDARNTQASASPARATALDFVCTHARYLLSKNMADFDVRGHGFSAAVDKALMIANLGLPGIPGLVARMPEPVVCSYRVLSGDDADDGHGRMSTLEMQRLRDTSRDDIVIVCATEASDDGCGNLVILRNAREPLRLMLATDITDIDLRVRIREFAN
jgi:hypothetical protein